ncbi:hypothetical protein MCOR25_007952 [Pyricularia grisea]|nr:hypothetical protein MCOR25_007952 [Pyricularia grisea]
MSKINTTHFEHSYTGTDPENLKGHDLGAHAGTVQLFDGEEVILIPSPSKDPKDPLNYPSWKKWAIVILVSAYSSTAVILSSGMGAFYTKVVADYPGQEKKANDLLTYPTLFMGLGNVISMPLALTIGRRPVFLGSIFLMTAAGLGCIFSRSLDVHIAFRDIMSLAAGQSEAISPMIISEIHFLHERSRRLSWFIFIQNVSVGVFFIATQFLVDAHGWRWWYGLFTIINGVVAILSVVFAAETMWDRHDTDGSSPGTVQDGAEPPVTLSNFSAHRASLGPIPWHTGLGLMVKNPKWKKIPIFYTQVMQGFCIWPIMWVFLVNGIFLGLYVFQAATFATVLTEPPFSLAFVSLAYVQGAQIIPCIVFLPLLGYGADYLVRAMSRRRGSVYNPEYRLIPFVVPVVVFVVCAVVYGQAAALTVSDATSSSSMSWGWPSIAVSYNGAFFAFLGANVVGIAYAVDAFPSRTGPHLVLICAGRGLVSFGLSYATLPAVQALGYAGIMNVYAILGGVVSLFGVAVYFFGRRAREWAYRTFKIDEPRE